MPKLKTTNLCILEFKHTHGDNYNYSLTKYTGSKNSIIIICKHCGNNFEQIANDHKNGHGCPNCAINKNTQSKRSILCNLITKANEIHDDFYNYDNIKLYKNKHTVYDIICPIHGIFTQSLHSHINKKRGCSKCATEKRKDTLNMFITKSNEIHDDFYKYDLVIYRDSKTKVKIICSIHGIFTQRPKDHINNRQGCPICKESKGEKVIDQYLHSINIEFERQKTFKGCKYKCLLKFDFYLPCYNLCIEFDGEQHYTPIEHFGGEKEFRKIQKKDQIKTDYCKQNGINLIRIRYDDNIESELNKIL